MGDDMRLGSPKRKNNGKPVAPTPITQGAPGFNFKEQPSSYQTKSESGIVPLVDNLDLDYIPEEWQHEYVYSRLLEQMLPLVKSILNEKTKWRVHELLIRKLGNVLGYFNASEI
jgi:hypothetical protein